jgi:hypothetical protein
LDPDEPVMGNDAIAASTQIQFFGQATKQEITSLVMPYKGIKFEADLDG